jgi:hypothetical protein
MAIRCEGYCCNINTQVRVTRLPFQSVCQSETSEHEQNYELSQSVKMSLERNVGSLSIQFGSVRPRFAP